MLRPEFRFRSLCTELCCISYSLTPSYILSSQRQMARQGQPHTPVAFPLCHPRCNVWTQSCGVERLRQRGELSFKRQDVAKPDHIHSQVWSVGCTRNTRSSLCGSFSLPGFPLGDSESREGPAPTTALPHPCALGCFLPPRLQLLSQVLFCCSQVNRDSVRLIGLTCLHTPCSHIEPLSLTCQGGTGKSTG